MTILLVLKGIHPARPYCWWRITPWTSRNAIAVEWDSIHPSCPYCWVKGIHSKGHCHEIFFSTSSFFLESVSLKPLSICIIRTVKFFFSNSQRYSQLKVHHRCCWHRWQMEKSSIIKVLIILCGHLWKVELTYRYIYAFKVTVSSKQPDTVPIICNRCHWQRWQICHRYQQH